VSTPNPEAQALRKEIERLRARLHSLREQLREPEEIIRAIRHGEVDSFVVVDTHGEQIYSLRSVDLLYRAMVEDMGDGAVALDPSGMILFCNRYFAGLVGAERETLVGTSIFPLVPDESRRFFDGLDRCPQAARRGEVILRARDGASVPVHVAMNLLTVEGEDIFCVIITDRTPERRRQELVVEGRRKDEFLATLAHELRNSIAPIRYAVELLKRSPTEERGLAWATELIDRQTRQIGGLVDDLLDVSRIVRGKIRVQLQPVHLGTIIAYAVETARPGIEARRHQLTIEVPDAELRVNADAGRLSQVVSNLLQNAAKFTPEGGHIAVKLYQDDGQARISVRDDGIGIPADMFGRIFEAFTQIDSSMERSQGGLGIGLALVRRLVELHGGQVEVRSEGKGTGTEFIVSLPLLPAAWPAAVSPHAAAGTSPALATGRRILIVDDNPDAVESLAQLLRWYGHEARTLTSGARLVAEALEFRPEVVLLDLSLPDVSGYDVAAELRRHPGLAQVRLIALTGYGGDEHRQRSREAGFDDHWVKPLDASQLQRLLASLPEESPGS
jgi:PAS domain S-box-containing protein